MASQNNGWGFFQTLGLCAVAGVGIGVAVFFPGVLLVGGVVALEAGEVVGGLGLLGLSGAVAGAEYVAVSTEGSGDGD